MKNHHLRKNYEQMYERLCKDLNYERFPVGEMTDHELLCSIDRILECQSCVRFTRYELLLKLA